MAAIFATNSGWKPAPTPSPGGSSPESSTVLVNDACANVSSGVVDADAMNAGKTTFDDLTASVESDTPLPRIYGAQQRNMIVDARPTVNAMVMQAVGQGSEKMEWYPNAEKAYLGIDNIHVMRKSLNSVVDALKDSDFVAYVPAPKTLANSNWLKHIDNILRGTSLIARTVGIMHSHVLIHCSDGWDRTSQLSALSQLCLDPYYRTMEGFMVLVEKDWLSFGHMFRHRSGFLGSDKWFEVENERVERRPDGSGGGNPFENALRGARGLFGRENRSSDSLSQAAEMKSTVEPSTTDLPLPSDTAPGSTTIGAAEEHRVTKVNELSPVFHQFLDATYQLMSQYPTRFEFNERFLRRLLYHLYSCQYGTFLFDSEKERVEARAKLRTRSVWDYFLCRRAEFTNPDFDPIVDDAVRGRERMIFPQEGKVRWWAEAFGRPDSDMNSKPTTTTTDSSRSPPSSQALSSGQTHKRSPSRSGATTPNNAPWTRSFREANDMIEDNPIVLGTETASTATGAGTTTHAPENLLPRAAEWSQSLGQNISKGLAAGIATLGIKESSRVSPHENVDEQTRPGEGGETDPLGAIPLSGNRSLDDVSTTSATTDMGEAGRGSSVRREVAVDMQ